MINLNTLIKLLKMIYDDISQKYTVLIRLKTCWQMNYEFISFYSEFLALMSKLNWNEDAKIIILQKMIFNKVQNQLIDRNMLSILTEFAVLCQWIDEDLCLNQISWYQQLNAQQNFWSVILVSSNLSASTHNLMNINVTHTQYVSAESDEWKTCLTKNKCFDYNQKKHYHKNCLINSYNKIW